MWNCIKSSCAPAFTSHDKNACEQVTQVKEESQLLPGDVARLVLAIPRTLGSDEAAANVLNVAKLLRLHGVPDFALSSSGKTVSRYLYSPGKLAIN